MVRKRVKHLDVSGLVGRNTRERHKGVTWKTLYIGRRDLRLLLVKDDRISARISGITTANQGSLPCAEAPAPDICDSCYPEMP
jgi:hypothetical protein